MTRTELYQCISLQSDIVEKMEALSKEIDLEELNPYLERLMCMETAPEAYKYLDEYFQHGSGVVNENVCGAPDTESGYEKSQELSDMETGYEKSQELSDMEPGYEKDHKPLSAGRGQMMRRDPDHWKMLYCQLECARRLYDKYQERHIPDQVFADTMKCYTRFLGECEKKNGRKFYDRGWWTYRQISMNLLRVGDLEFQFKEYDGQLGIDLHIPSDAVFTREAVDASFDQAKKLLADCFPEYKYTRFTCDSWLLSPVLGELLPETSKILDFQRRFEILRRGEEEDCIEWLFQSADDVDYEKLPEKTSLQRKVKKVLLEGGSIGTGFGVLRE